MTSCTASQSEIDPDGSRGVTFSKIKVNIDVKQAQNVIWT